MRRLLLFVLCLLLSFGAHAEAQLGKLENPPAPSNVVHWRSGIGTISGWTCEAERVFIIFNLGTEQELMVQAAYGTEREDTRAACGDTNNGFGLLFNWNLLGDGEHTVMVWATLATARPELPKWQLKQAQVLVKTFGTEITVPESAGTYFRLNNFPHPGEHVIIRWDQALQNFVITPLRMP